MPIFSLIFLSNYWWQTSDIWSQASYRYPISWEAFFDPSNSYFLFAEERGYLKWALAHSSSCFHQFFPESTLFSNSPNSFSLIVARRSSAMIVLKWRNDRRLKPKLRREINFDWLLVRFFSQSNLICLIWFLSNLFLETSVLYTIYQCIFRNIRVIHHLSMHF